MKCSIEVWQWKGQGGGWQKKIRLAEKGEEAAVVPGTPTEVIGQESHLLRGSGRLPTHRVVYPPPGGSLNCTEMSSQVDPGSVHEALRLLTIQRDPGQPRVTSVCP